jgi:formate C-acetyltransferase
MQTATRDSDTGSAHAAGSNAGDRISRLRDRALAWNPDPLLGWLRDYLYLEGWMAADGMALPIRNAAALANVVERMPAVLSEDDLLVGEHGNGGETLNFRARQPGDYAERVAASPLADDCKERFLSWLASDPFRYQELAPVAPWPAELRQANERGVIQVWGTDLNHSIRGYEKLLRLGFDGLGAEAAAELAALPRTDPEAPRKRANLLSWQRICEAGATLGRRHAAEARRRAEAATLASDRLEWQAAAAGCDQVPAGPARTFREALQALWFAHMVTVWEDGVNANGLGRIDQLLWPYLESDLAAARIDMDEAADLLAALWIKLYQPYDVQQVMLGGLLPDGSDAVNPLSYLALDVTERLGFVRCLSARLHRRSPRRFLSRCVDLVAQGGGIPFFFNDEALVPALVSQGVPLEDARGYAAIGCIEITLPGKANPHAVSHWINVAKCLELAINDGCDMLDGARLGPPTGTLEDHETIDDVVAALDAQLAHFADWSVYGSNSAELAHRSQWRLPYLSLLTEDCVRRGADIMEGGARYNYHSSAAMGIPNAADSLAALRSAVYDRSIVSRRDLLAALRADFDGCEDLRVLLRERMPKYGNDEPVPDAYAADLVRRYCARLGSHRTPSGGKYHVHLFTFVLMLQMGKLTAASPDGRHAGEPLAYSVSPGQGRDRTGLTAVIRSLAALPHDLVAASSSAILEVDPALLDGPGRRAFDDLLATAVDLGVGQMQFNVVSADTLRAAQAEPERYRNLAVRVSGFSQQFCLLDREMQDHIIARTKHRR